MKTPSDKVQKINVFLLYLTIPLILLPPVYLPFTQNNLFTSPNLVRLISLFLLFSVLKFYQKGQAPKISRSLSSVALFYFFTQSLSVLNASDLPAFLSEYKNLVFSIIIFYVTILTISKKNVMGLLITFLVSGVAGMAYELLVYFYPTFIYSYLKPIFYDPYWAIFDYQYQRGRFFGDIFVEITIPFAFFALFIYRETLVKAAVVVFINLVSFLALVSNWRSKVLVLILGLLLSTLYYFRRSVRVVIVLSLSLIIFLGLALIVSRNIIGTNTLDRLLLSNKEDVQSIFSRFSYWKESINMMSSSPLTGVGLGNYFDYLPAVLQVNNRSSRLNPAGSFIVIDNPHNIFFTALANTGLLGFLSFIILTIYFLKTDWEINRISNSHVIPFIISFWGLFLYAILNPGTFFTFQFLFWFLRGTIYKLR